ncbi:MAG: hypothetical protein K2K44_07140, partial [Oscillospiraceae bacterium]|nr:hypothetical protein [Oscillospiraceae bacterium]
MLKKLKKFFPAIISAVLCVTMVLGMTVSAQSVKSCLSECAKLANSSFDQNYIDLAIKYHNKEAKNTISFGKSKAKKFLKKLNSQAASAKPEFSIEMSDKNSILFLAKKNSRIKAIECDELGYSYDGLAVYTDGKSTTAFSVTEKIKTKVPADANKYISINIDGAEDIIGLPDDMTGKYFKFKSGGKIYCYEEFLIEEWGDETVGFLFDENGNILAMLS